MGGFVLDASAAVALLVSNQETAASRAFAVALPNDLSAPSVFGLEVRHAILKLERRGLLPVGLADAPLAALEAATEFEAAPDAARLALIMGIARIEKLSAYDAAYLELSIRTQATLVSRDAAPIAAASRRGVHVIDLR